MSCFCVRKHDGIHAPDCPSERKLHGMGPFQPKLPRMVSLDEMYDIFYEKMSEDYNSPKDFEESAKAALKHIFVEKIVLKP